VGEKVYIDIFPNYMHVSFHLRFLSPTKLCKHKRFIHAKAVPLQEYAKKSAMRRIFPFRKSLNLEYKKLRSRKIKNVSWVTNPNSLNGPMSANSLLSPNFRNFKSQEEMTILRPKYVGNEEVYRRVVYPMMMMMI